jgi:LmbE family N-acetylglucosaminyl deacetylase
LDDGDPRPLRDVRAEELACAADALALDHHVLLDYPDARLAEIPIDELTDQVVVEATRHRADAFVVFDVTGITGHPDHQAATRAALAAADRLHLPVLAWSVPSPVAVVLNVEFGANFTGRARLEIDVTLSVDRTSQLRAIACHRSQSAHNPVLWRRLELSGGDEPLLWLRRPAGHDGSLPTATGSPARRHSGNPSSSRWACTPRLRNARTTSSA